MIEYCKSCLFPNTKPDLQFDAQGICSACNYFTNRPQTDWDKRYQELLKIVEKYKNTSGSNWDCIVPGSGGKDSTTQALRAREIGLNPLIVTATTCDLTEIGRKNIENSIWGVRIIHDTCNTTPLHTIEPTFNGVKVA